MRIKKFEAPTLVEALHQVKTELGPDAVILQTQKADKKSMFGLRKKTTIQVTAALDINLMDKKVNVNVSNGDPSEKFEAEREFEKRFVLLQRQLSDVSEMIMELKQKVSTPDLNGLGPELNQLYRHMIVNQINEDLALALVEEIKNAVKQDSLEPDSIKEVAVNMLASRIPTKGQIKADTGKPKVIALIGPTGVGKTTTIAKLAARFGLTEGKKVALITADTYRIAAVDQLKIYAEIMDIPLDVVFTPAQMKPALAKHQDKDIVFIDTAGRSPQVEKQLDELHTFLRAAKPDETHLVVSANTKLEDLERVVESFGKGRINRLIFTKLDETLTLGSMINILVNKSIPLSYVTNGQNVPDDIVVYTSERLAGMVLDGASAEKS